MIKEKLLQQNNHQSNESLLLITEKLGHQSLKEIGLNYHHQIERYIKKAVFRDFDLNFGEIEEILNNHKKKIIAQLKITEDSPEKDIFKMYAASQEMHDIMYQLLIDVFKILYEKVNDQKSMVGMLVIKNKFNNILIKILNYFHQSLKQSVQRKRDHNYWFDINNINYIPIKEKSYLLFVQYSDFAKDHINTEDVSNTFLEVIKNCNLDIPYEEKSEIGDHYYFVIAVTDLIGVEQTRKKLNQLIEENRSKDDENAVDNLEYARSFITPNHDKIAIENLQKFYQEKIKFEEYDVNKKMTAKEVRLLRELINEKDKILEMGCGTGRLISELVQDDKEAGKSGPDVTGFDYTERHIKLTKQAMEQAGKQPKVFQGDWHHNAIKDGSFDKIYSLGRNILHDYSLIDQVQLFREAHRILKPGGQFIFDIPNREKGGYKMLVKEYAKEMKDRGIKNFRYGAIYDSPDGKHFTTRYVYSHQDIEELACLTGFKIKETRKEQLATGKGDENLYYVLQKI